MGRIGFVAMKSTFSKLAKIAVGNHLSKMKRLYLDSIIDCNQMRRITATQSAVSTAVAGRPYSLLLRHRFMSPSIAQRFSKKPSVFIDRGLSTYGLLCCCSVGPSRSPIRSFSEGSRHVSRHLTGLKLLFGFSLFFSVFSERRNYMKNNPGIAVSVLLIKQHDVRALRAEAGAVSYTWQESCCGNHTKGRRSVLRPLLGPWKIVRKVHFISLKTERGAWEALLVACSWKTTSKQRIITSNSNAPCGRSPTRNTDSRSDR